MTDGLLSSIGGGIPSQLTPDGTPEFVNLDPKYVCILCNGVLRDAVQTSCGHRFCQGCIERRLNDAGEPIPCPYREESCNTLTKDEINRDSSARREVRSLEVYCRYKEKGCPKTVQWKDLQKHERDCEYRTVPCPYRENGCQEDIIVKELEIHTESCGFKPYTCQFCGESIPRCFRERHEKTECRKIPIPCQYDCGINPLPRELMEAHWIECPKRPVKCRFSSMGCEFQGTQEAVGQHEKEATEDHLQLVTMYTANMDLQSIEIRREVQGMSTDYENSQRVLAEVQNNIGSLQTGIESLKNSVKDVKRKIVAQTERVIHVERKLEELAKKDLVEKHSRDLQGIHQTLANTAEKLSQLERAGLGSGNAIGEQDATVNTGDVISQIQNHDRQLGIQDIRLAELDLRYQVLETASYDGVLMWKIRDYVRRKGEAVTGRTLSLYSQPFYTSRFGYKMCARVYLNGDGMGKGTHLSLFFVVMRGEYDALLPWPFQQKVTLMMLDQDIGNRHLTDTFRPDPSSTSFRRPTSEMNVASGCPLFVSHAVLETRTYLRDDTIFIKVVVDTDGINPP